MAISLCLLGTSSTSFAQDAPIIQPGAPGQAARTLTADEAIKIANTSYSPADVRFMTDMIPHHNQAVQMADLVADRTNQQELKDVAGRIDASQEDEIAFMQEWLQSRGEDVPDPTAHEAMHTSHVMAGMATPEQMAELAAANGTDFDRLFLVIDDCPSCRRGDDGRGAARTARFGLRYGVVRVLLQTSQMTRPRKSNA